MRRFDERSGEPIKTGMSFGFLDLKGAPAIWIEGRPVQVVEEELQVDQLMPTVQLPVAEESLRSILRDWDIETDPAGLSRLDLTAEANRQGSEADCSAILRGVSALTVPRRKTEIIFDNRNRSIETCYFIGRTGRKFERIYRAKGTHQETAELRPGTVRFEAQTRHGRDKRMTAEGWDERTCALTFEKQFATMAKAADGITIAGSSTLHSVIRERIESGEMTARKAMRLLGYIELQAADLTSELPKATRNRITAELRDEGLVAADKSIHGSDEYERFDLGEAFEEISVAFSLN